MKPALRGRVLAAGVALTLACGLSPSRAAVPAIENAPANLVRAALEAELAGAPHQTRDALLEQALAADPDFAPARWQSGYVKIGRQWVKLDDVPRHAAGDWQLAEYRKRRDAMIDTADAHRELARWCRQTRLVEQERVHWAKVLEFDRDNAEALTALGLQRYDGRLMTESQIEQERTAARKRARDSSKWQPQVAKWRKAIQRGNDRQRTAALAAMKQLDDPDAIPALESAMALDGPGESVLAVNRALMETVGRMNVPEATQVLLRRAVLAEPAAVRDLAIDELKKRPLHAYVPQLIEALPGSVKTEFQVYLMPNGLVVHDHAVLFEGREANVRLALESIVDPADAAAALRIGPAAAQRESQRAATIEAQARAVEERLAPLRERLHYALSRTTGFEAGDDPDSWVRAYNEYLGAYTPASEKPTFVVARREYEGVATPPGLDTVTRYTRQPPRITGGCECFPAGTLIATQRGPRTIEDVKIGDMLLAQDTASGELAYKAVQATTLRPPVELIEIACQDESLLATAGHPFWVVGEGWRMAQQLKPGYRLHTIGGAREVTAVKRSRPREAYNLVVSDFHTYFVGEAKVLVHDNAPLEEQPQQIPGLVSAGR